MRQESARCLCKLLETDLGTEVLTGGYERASLQDGKVSGASSDRPIIRVYSRLNWITKFSMPRDPGDRIADLMRTSATMYA
jgi:hypothetical protein